ncbi:DNA alkylation response protein [Actinomycetospora sp. NBRC 106375]|uniref:acyl-CoA dehydrogenase family protein n=1 Tax=Actinomycetospora sp. NBRC 106375 TaxID=3032207 RepID=UPI0024A2653B|nr:acyl-CoA dehydrogenase family protein [Actinomycetospora sp. NBRC 106375]GLZ47024.1 DNA alkylation response protein [Actinomycetospora sp. NBRC 106375]
MSATHEVTNQVPDLVGHDVAADPPLLEALEREGAGWYRDELGEIGRLAGSASAQEWADAAHRHEPRLRTHDRVGHRVDEVDYDPGYHALLTEAVGRGFAGAPWAEQSDDRPGAHVARAAGFLTWSQLEAGHGCPISMTYAVLPALRAAPELLAQYGPGLTSRAYDPGLRAPDAKRGLLAGMGMTEKQGGSDVRANATVARPEGDHYRLTGHKWFTSAPMCDLFLVLAQAPGGLTCFLVPRVLPDGTRNTFRIQRLKDKLGNRSNASSEPEFDETVAWRVGDEGRGVRTIIEMVACTRLDNALGSAAGMRTAVSRAAHHARYRSAFGRPLISQPLMREVLADLALESEAAVTLALRLAGAQDRSGTDEHEAAFRRIGVTLGKYWICKRQTAVVGEALECLGGNGYVEESGMPRLFRESPLNSIWEGSGNVNALDLLRILAREPASLEAWRAEVSGVDDRIDAGRKEVEAELAHADERSARRLTERMAVLLSGALLVRHAPASVADAYVAARVTGESGYAFGTLPRGTDVDALLARLPETERSGARRGGAVT